MNDHAIVFTETLQARGNSLVRVGRGVKLCRLGIRDRPSNVTVRRPPRSDFPLEEYAS